MKHLLAIPLILLAGCVSNATSAIDRYCLLTIPEEREQFRVLLGLDPDVERICPLTPSPEPGLE